MKDNSIMSRVFVPIILVLTVGIPVWGSYIIPDGSVTTAKIATGAVTQAKLPARSTGTTVGPGGVAISSTTGTQSTTSSSYTSFASVTITTTGRPVLLMMQPDNSGGIGSGFQCYKASGTAVTNSCSLAWFRGASQISSGTPFVMQLPGVTTSGASNTIISNPLSATYLDAVAAGTYTYSIQGLANNSSTLSVLNEVVVAYEL